MRWSTRRGAWQEMPTRNAGVPPAVENSFAYVMSVIALRAGRPRYVWHSLSHPPGATCGATMMHAAETWRKIANCYPDRRFSAHDVRIFTTILAHGFLHFASDTGAQLAAIPAVLADMQAGRMVVLIDDEDRENEGIWCVRRSILRRRL